jgi:hypothetical protein
MARYAFYCLVQPRPDLPQIIAELLSEQGLMVTYKTDDYVMAQESAGKIPFNKLAKVEVLIHKSDMQIDRIKLTCVTKNGELQLQTLNYCQSVSDKLLSAFRTSTKWQFLEQLNE